MVETVLHYLIHDREGLYVDACLGAAGYAAAILESLSPAGRLIGIDRDPTARDLAQKRLERYGNRVNIVADNFRNLRGILDALDVERVQGVVFDLGLSSMQLADLQRGFSYQADSPLDMRSDPDIPMTAADVINTYSEADLADIFWRYGEERRSRQVARAIVRSRAGQPIQSTRQLAEVLRPALGGRWYHRSLARIWMALRIVVNDELDALREGLAQAVSALAVGGRIVVLAYHSLEDRIVKLSFRAWGKRRQDGVEYDPALNILTKRPLTADEQEVEDNARARPAKLRAAEKRTDATVEPIANNWN